MQKPEERLPGDASTARVEAFSDGVLAIVVTLLVLDIKVPQHVSGGDAILWSALAERIPAIGAWVVSFLFVLVFWVAHHTLFTNLSKVNRTMLWLNGLFLLAISFTPFPTALAGEYPGATPAVFLLCLAMFLAAASFSLMRWYAAHARLFDESLHVAARKAALKRSLLAPVLYALAMALAFPWPWVAVALQAAVPLLFVFPPRSVRDPSRGG